MGWMSSEPKIKKMIWVTNLTSIPVNMHLVITFYERGRCNEDDEHAVYGLEAISGWSSQWWKAIAA
jgi:hypothetical protein